jgi:RimJ/RimL family protein N-acetyltransferase
VSDPSAAPTGVTIRALAREDLELITTWRNDPEHETEYGDFLVMHRRRNSYPERWDDSGLLTEDEGELLVCVNGEPAGVVQYFPSRYGPNRGSTALCLGIALQPAHRGRGVGTAAQRLVCDYLFAQTLVHRVEASTDVTNLAEQRALTKAGFTRDGVLRGAQYRRGEWHDLVLYSRLRTD